MSVLTDKLSELSLLLEPYSDSDYFQLALIKEIIQNVGKSFSGSWIGYHSQVYYENYKLPPDGAIFSVEWGIESPYGIRNGTIGNWKICSSSDVIQYIFHSAKLENLERIKKISNDVKNEFTRIKESLLSIISITNDNSRKSNDSYYEKIINEIEHNKPIQSADCLTHISPKGSFASRDSRAMMNGTQTPPHIFLLCQIVELEDPSRCCKELNLSIKKLITHYSNKESLLMIGSNNTMSSNKVFIVHGHDSLAKTEVARFIEKLGLTAVILHEQVDAGSTIIEKLEQNTDVGFGIVLYTPCDFGGNNNAPSIKENRSRQNVVFEHGYLLAKLGRSRVCALVKNEVVCPSDVSGVVFKIMDSQNAWELKLARELKNSGFEIDFNNV